jgi:two-component system, sensor histidine kinase
MMTVRIAQGYPMNSSVADPKAARTSLVDVRRKAQFFLAARRMPVPGTLIWLTLGWIAHFDVDARYALAWALAGAAVFLGRSVLLQMLLPKSENEWQVARASQSVLVCGALLGGLAAIGALFVFPYLSSERQALLTMVYMGWFAGGAGVNGTYPRWFYVWAAPLMTSLIIAWGLQGSVTSLAVAALLVMLSAMLVTTLRNYTEQIVQALQLQTELAERSEQLQRALTLKASFMAATSHDLRQPVTSLGLLNFALQQATSHEAGQSIAMKMTAPIEALRTMLNSLMEISQLESSALKVQEQAFSMADICQKLADEYREQLADRPVELRLFGEDYLVHADLNLVERIIRNLLSNAVKFTAQGLITLAYTVNGNELRIRVTDTGIGIAAEDQVYIFGDYHQVNNASRTRDKGLGLGLAIVERITQLLKGTISLDSERGKGSTFCVRLPVSQVRLIELREVPATAARSSKQLLTGLFVLVVDDDRLVRDSIGTLLSVNGAELVSYENAEQALNGLQQLTRLPDIALIDYQLSGGRNGIDMLNIMRLQHSQIQGVLLTGNTDPVLVGEVERAGAKLLHKPVRAERLLRIIEACRLPAGQTGQTSQTGQTGQASQTGAGAPAVLGNADATSKGQASVSALV